LKIKNKFNQKYIEVNNNYILCKNDLFYMKKNNNSKINNSFIFILLKLYEEADFKKNYLKIIDKEPIDIVVKYIDLTDKQLKRAGINQIYKDKDNEELKYSLRSIFQNLPWIRNIYIIMPNEKVKFLKSKDRINEKIFYIKDSDILGFDSANIFAFTFNLYKLENFGISKNFIYMEDDFFIGKKLRKSDFFYYDINQRKILPYLLTYHFQIMNVSDILMKYEKLIKSKDSIHPHSREGWYISILNTELFLLEKYNRKLITTNFTHNAIPENLNELREIYKEIQTYKYINETLFSKERNILTLNQPHFLNLYQLNIMNKKVHSIAYRYIQIENINKIKINSPLFVINTGGNHIPLSRHYRLEKKYMEKMFPFEIKYEVKSNLKKLFITKIKLFFILLRFYILSFLLKFILYN
jgi:hypothetical protein